MLAIKRVKDIQSGVKRFSSAENRTALEVKCRIVHPPGISYAGYMHHGQDVAINPCPNNVTVVHSPASNENLPDFRTFHHPPSEAVEYVPCGAYGPSSPSHIIYRPDIVAIQVRHPSGARSLENLEDGRENRHRTFLQVDTRWNSTTAPAVNCVERTGMSGLVTAVNSPAIQAAVQTSSSGGGGALQGPAGCTWRRGSLDDGDITPTNECISYEMEGGGTLPRPKVSIKPRPVAKIMAKTRLPAGDGDLIFKDSVIVVADGGDGEIVKGSCDGSVGNGSVVIHAEVNNSPRRSLPGSPLNSILRGKKVPPPPPPKRSNSIKGERKGRASDGDACGDYSSEQLFASCVKSIASKFGLSRKNEWNDVSSARSSASSSPCKTAAGGADKKPQSLVGGKLNSTYGSGASHPASAKSDGSALTTAVPAATTTTTNNNNNSLHSQQQALDDILEDGGIIEAPDRTPPSPAPGSPVHMRRDSAMCQSAGACLQSSGGGGGGGSASPDSSCSPVFHASMRNDSTSSFDSNGSTSSTDSNNLPFANENVGTIKQRVNKPHPSITMLDLASSPRSSPLIAAKNSTLTASRSTPATPKRRSSLGTDRTPPNCLLMEMDETDQAEGGDARNAGRAEETGDVLSDIDNMLANLTEELDAMLTSDLQSQ